MWPFTSSTWPITAIFIPHCEFSSLWQLYPVSWDPFLLLFLRRPNIFVPLYLLLVCVDPCECVFPVRTLLWLLWLIQRILLIQLHLTCLIVSNLLVFVQWMIEVTLTWPVLFGVKRVCALYNQILRNLIVVAPYWVLNERVYGRATLISGLRQCHVCVGRLLGDQWGPKWSQLGIRKEILGIWEVFHNVGKLVREGSLRLVNWRCFYESCLTMTWDLLREMKVCSCSPRCSIFISLGFLNNLHCIIKVVCFVNVLAFPSIRIHMWLISRWKHFTLKLKLILSKVSLGDTCEISSLNG